MTSPIDRHDPEVAKRQDESPREKRDEVALPSYVAAVDDEMRAQVRTDDALLRPFYAMMEYHLGLDAPGPSGKRVRPLICLLVHEGLAGDFRAALPAAAAIELLHNFTLVHDDIEDQDPTRRHRPTVWARWGVPQAINVGDGMYALSRVAVQRLRGLCVAPERILDATAVLDRACVLVCEGQYLDISFEARTDVDAGRYRAMVERKTGALFRAAAELGGVLAGADRARLEALRRFGERYGAAFQAHDDLLGIWGAAATTGKAEMNDIAKRKMSLPLVLALERASAEQRATIDAVYESTGPVSDADMRGVRDIVDALGVRADVARYAALEREVALAALADARLTEEPGRLLRQLVSETTGASA